MNQYKVNLLEKEFPFLSVIAKIVDVVQLELNWIDNIRIQKGDANLLKQTGQEDSYSWSGGGYYEYKKYFTIDCNGEVTELSSSGQSGTGSGDNNEWTASPIDEQIFSKGIVPDFIVECVKNDTDNNGNGTVRYHWTIFKMKKFDLKTHHKNEIDKAAAALKAEIEAAYQE